MSGAKERELLDPAEVIGAWARRALELGSEMDRAIFEREFGELYQEVGWFKRTRLNLYRFAQLGLLTRIVVNNEISGDYVEFGTWRGGSLYLVAHEWRRLGQQRQLFGFDSFEGLPEPDGCRDGHALHAGMFGDNDFEETNQFFVDKGLNGVHLIRGWFSDTIGALADKQVALCHIDADCYDSVKLALEWTYDRVVPDGFIVVDDYRHPACSGATIAVEEFFARRREEVHQSPGIDCSGWIRKSSS